MKTLIMSVALAAALPAVVQAAPAAPAQSVDYSGHMDHGNMDPNDHKGCKCCKEDTATPSGGDHQKMKCCDKSAEAEQSADQPQPHKH